MEIGVASTVAQYAEEVMGQEGFRYVSAVVANCKMLALELESQDDAGTIETIDSEALVIAGYLHDISTVVHGFHDHHLKSAGMAVEYLQLLAIPDERIRK